MSWNPKHKHADGALKAFSASHELESFDASDVEALLDCHVSTVEAHGLCDQGILACDGACEFTHKGKVPNLVVPPKRDAKGRRIKESPEEHNARMALIAEAMKSDGRYYRDRKGFPLTVDRSPCLFKVVDQAAFKVWMTAKIEQRERHHNPVVRERVLADKARMGAEHASLAAAELTSMASSSPDDAGLAAQAEAMRGHHADAELAAAKQEQIAASLEKAAAT